MRPTVLGPIRHTCEACGAGCHGTDVLVADDEREALAARAAELGETEPFDGAHLRKAGGRCVFLDPDSKCRIHREFGLTAKPLVCQQYPLFARQVGLETRLGVDPGCLHAWRSWEDGPEVPDGTRIHRSRGGQPMAWNGEEQALVSLLVPGRRSVGALIEGLGGDTLVAHIAERLVASRIGGRIAHPGTAESLRSALARTTAMLEDLDPGAPPELALGPAMDRWSVETLRRLVWFRFPADAPPRVRLMSGLAGVLAVGWTDPSPEHYGPGLAAWTRVVRTPAWHHLWP